MSMSISEVAAVALAIVYLLLVIQRNIWCWAAAFCSTLIYLVVMYEAGLYMESALQLFYAGMAIYGWSQWREDSVSGALKISCWSVKRHLQALGLVVVLSATSGFLLQNYSEAALPYLDSFTTWGALISTWMVARKILENWLYWFVIDSVSIYLFISRELYLSAMLFGLYLILILFGYKKWRAEFLSERDAG
jgi:nicotinamide mononucleotide transporter